MKKQEKIAIVGDGGWGTAIAMLLADKGYAVAMWGHDPEYLKQMRARRENFVFLPGFALPENLEFEPDFAKAVRGALLVIEAVPTKFLRAAFARARAELPERCGVVSLTKGLEGGTLKRPSQVLAELAPQARVGVLSGPSHAEEVAKKLPASVTVAAEDDSLARLAQETLMSPCFRVYTSRDVAGLELGGALKNVIALAAGVCCGLGLGDNALSALLTRGLAEIGRLGAALGAEPATFAGLSGMGDLITTCYSPFGRNRAVGIELAKGRKLAEILAERPTVAEGVNTAASALALAEAADVDMPITAQVCRILAGEISPRAAVTELMSREGKAE